MVVSMPMLRLHNSLALQMLSSWIDLRLLLRLIGSLLKFSLKYVLVRRQHLCDTHLLQARPGYLTLPTDIAYEKIPSGRLKTPLTSIPPPNDPDVEETVINEIVKLVKEADQNVVILVDACTIRHYVREEVEDLAKRTQFPVYAGQFIHNSISS
jgi:hypothetical protein